MSAAIEALHRAGVAQRARARRRPPPSRGRARRLGGALRSLSARLGGWRERARQRRRLLTLADNPHLLRDLGLSRADALSEGDKPFWRD